jgi:hypothetical protein
MGRLKPHVDLEAARSELGPIARRLAAENPEAEAGSGVRLEPLSEAVVTPLIRRLLLMLFGAVVLVLVLACSNVTNLTLVRTSLRRRELAVRRSLGAGRARLVRQLLTESLLLGLAAGGMGLLLAAVGTRQVVRLAGAQLPRAHEVGLDWRVFLFLFAACTVVGVVVGLVPALLTSRSEPSATLRASGGGNTLGAAERRLCDGLVITEIALAFLLAVGAVVLVREMVRLRDTDPGMVTRDVVTFHLGKHATPGADGLRYGEIVDRVAGLPGVRAAGVAPSPRARTPPPRGRSSSTRRSRDAAARARIPSGWRRIVERSWGSSATCARCTSIVPPPPSSTPPSPGTRCSSRSSG